jgi:uracil phosphoribosyltransferase
MVATGDTLTYTLGAMKPETADKDVITADAVAKQETLNKVSHELLNVIVRIVEMSLC